MDDEDDKSVRSVCVDLRELIQHSGSALFDASKQVPAAAGRRRYQPAGAALLGRRMALHATAGVHVPSVSQACGLVC